MERGYYTDAKRLIDNVDFDVNIQYFNLTNKINELFEENTRLKNELDKINNQIYILTNEVEDLKNKLK